jgi:hypothetical protein
MFQLNQESGGNIGLPFQRKLDIQKQKPDINSIKQNLRSLEHQRDILMSSQEHILLQGVK